MKSTIPMFCLTILAFLVTDMALAGTCPAKHHHVPITHNTLYVNNDIPHSGNGMTWGTAFRTIQEAIDAVQKSDNSGALIVNHTIIVAQGTYFISDEQERHDQFGNLKIKALIQHENMLADLTILGGFTPGTTCLEERSHDPKLTVLKGGKDSIKAVLANFDQKFRRKKLTIDGFTIQDFGSMDESEKGGAVLVNGGHLIMKNIIFRDNVAKNGGAVAINNTEGLFERCSFFGNQAKRNGGVINIFVADSKRIQGLFINHCIIGGPEQLSNKAARGAFIFARQEQVKLKISYTDPDYGEMPIVDSQIAAPSESKHE